MTTNADEAHHDWAAWRRAWTRFQALYDTAGPCAVDGMVIDCRNPDCAGYVELRVRVGPPTAAEVQRITWRQLPLPDPRPTLVFHEHHEPGCPVHVHLTPGRISCR